MFGRSISLLLALLGSTAAVAETRQLDAHEHGVGALDIAVDGTTVVMAFEAPGADIVGFEYAAESQQDRAAVDAAIAALSRPLDLFALPAAAGCSVTSASAELETEASHDDHEHEEAHDHDHAEKDEHAKHDHDHDKEHASDEVGASHTEFHAEYTLNCAQPDELTEIEFAYFATFENARELDVQIATSAGAQAFEVVRDAPLLDLKNLF
jgi:hypothetical protein